MLQNLLPNLVPTFLIAMPVPDVSSKPISCSGLSELSTSVFGLFSLGLLPAFDYYQRSITASVRLLPAFDYCQRSITSGVRLLQAFDCSRRSFTADVRLQCSYLALHMKRIQCTGMMA